jgi:hypothetical protein
MRDDIAEHIPQMRRWIASGSGRPTPDQVALFNRVNTQRGLLKQVDWLCGNCAYNAIKDLVRWYDTQH